MKDELDMEVNKKYNQTMQATEDDPVETYSEQ
jgi:hypothetical protein